MNQIWPAVITLMGWVSYYWVGRHHWSGWALGIAAQTVWAVYAAETDQWAFVVSSAGYIWLAILGWRNLHQKQRIKTVPMTSAGGDSCVHPEPTNTVPTLRVLDRAHRRRHFHLRRTDTSR